MLWNGIGEWNAQLYLHYQQYLAFAQPYMEYAAPVWDPHCTSHINALEKVQKIGLRICYRAWSTDYEQLLMLSDLPPLAVRRKYLKLCYLFQVLNGHFSFPNPPISRVTADTRLRSTTSNRLLLKSIFAKTTAYQSSFFPSVISLWNRLPSDIQHCTSVYVFKQSLSTYL